MIQITDIALIQKASEQFDPDAAIPTDLLPVLEGFSIRRQLCSRRIVAECNEGRQTEVASRDLDSGACHSIQTRRMFILAVPQCVMSYLVGERMSEQP